MLIDFEVVIQVKKRLQYELEDYCNQWVNDIEDKELSMEQFCKKYQVEFGIFIKEFDFVREEKLFKQVEIMCLCEEFDELRFKWDDEVFNSFIWFKEKVWLELMFLDVMVLRDEVVNVYNDVQGKIVLFFQQVWNFWMLVDDIIVECDNFVCEK